MGNLGQFSVESVHPLVLSRELLQTLIVITLSTILNYMKTFKTNKIGRPTREHVLISRVARGVRSVPGPSSEGAPNYGDYFI